MRDRSHDEVMAERFREDPEYAVLYLNSTLEDGEQGELMIALRQMAKDDTMLGSGSRGFGLMPAISIARAAQTAIANIEQRAAK